MDKNLPSEKITITIRNNQYTSEISIGKIIDYSKNKAFYSGGMYNSITDGTTLDVIDIISALHAFFPDIKNDLKITDLVNLKPNEFSIIIDEMDKKFFPWYEQWIKLFQSAKKVDKKEKKDE